MKRKTIQGYAGLNYVTLVNVPIRDSKWGDVIAVNAVEMERRVAEELIKQCVPIRGRELNFLRKAVCNTSYEKFAALISKSASTVMHWEHAKDERLDLITEAALRSLFAEKLGIELQGWFHSLVSKDDAPKEVSVTLQAA